MFKYIFKKQANKNIKSQVYLEKDLDPENYLNLKQWSSCPNLKDLRWTPPKCNIPPKTKAKFKGH